MFDPDAYLQSKSAPQGGFDPDAYLQSKQQNLGQQPAQTAPQPRQVQSNQVAPPIDVKGAIQDRLRQKQEWSDLPGNIPSSAAKFVSDIGQVILHPIDTAKGLGNLAIGVIDKAASSLEESVPPEIRDRVNSVNNWIAQNVGGLSEIPEGGTKEMEGYKGEIAEKVGQFYADRYGGLEEAKQTLIQDPVGATADLSAILTLGGATVKQVPALSAAGQSVTKAGQAINPINIVGKAVSKTVVPAAKKAYTWGTGTTTGSGAEAVAAGLKPSANYKAAMRGTLGDEDVLKLARKSLNTLREQRSDAYTKTLSGIKNSDKVVDIKPIHNLADTWLGRFGVKKTPEGLDFSRSTLTGAAAKEAEEIYSMVKSWGKEAGDLTPSGMDVLKRRIGDFYTEGRNSRAMAESLSKAVKSKIVSQVPEYAKMTKEYSRASDAIKSVEQALLGKGGKASADTALRKLAMAAREEKGFRRSLIDMMDEVTGADVKGAVMGRAMNPAWSNRLGPMITATGLGVGGASNPWLLALLPAASPRAVGEFTAALGITGEALKKIKGIPELGVAASEVGKLPIYPE